MNRTKVLVRFSESSRDKSAISFVTRTQTGDLKCVRETSKCKKLIVLPSKNLKIDIIFGAQYECELLEMRNGARGFIATNITPVIYDVEVETIHVIKCVYEIHIKWGNNQQITFDPLDGRRASVRDENVIASYIRSRIDIRNNVEVADKFLVKARDLKRTMISDGVSLAHIRRS